MNKLPQLNKRLKDLFKKVAEKETKIVADKIEDKASKYFVDALNYVSDIIDTPIVYSVKTNQGIDVKAVGSQITFIEFGTGVYNLPYPSDYTRLEMAHSRGEYGLGRGKRHGWGFYANNGGNVAYANGDWSKDTKKGTVIITQGLMPKRCLYRAIKETKKEVNRR